MKIYSIRECERNGILPRCRYFDWFTVLVVTSLSDSEPNVSYSVIGMWSVRIFLTSESVLPSGLSDSKNYFDFMMLEMSMFVFDVCYLFSLFLSFKFIRNRDFGSVYVSVCFRLIVFALLLCLCEINYCAYEWVKWWSIIINEQLEI